MYRKGKREIDIRYVKIKRTRGKEEREDQRDNKTKRYNYRFVRIIAKELHLNDIIIIDHNCCERKELCRYSLSKRFPLSK